MSSKKIVKLIKSIFIIGSIFILIKLIVPVSSHQALKSDSQRLLRRKTTEPALTVGQIQGVWMTHIGTSFLIV